MRVLYLTHRLPYAPNRGDRVRAFHTLRFIAERTDVELLSFVHDREEAAHAGDLQDITPDVGVVPVPNLRNLVRASGGLLTRRPLTHLLLDAPAFRRALHEICERRRPDVVLAFCSGMARFALEPPLRDIPLVLDMVDVDSEKWRALAAQTAAPKRWIYQREARRLGEFEAIAAARASATLVVNEREAALARGLAPNARVHVVPNGVDVDGLRPPIDTERTPRVVFCGVMNYAPNEEGAIWLAREVWPHVHARRPDARLTILGSNPSRAVLAACAGDRSIDVTGTVTDVRPHLWTAAVSAAPLLVARGIQNKVLEATAAGLPSVVTPAVAEGLPAAVREACAVRQSPGSFADALVDMLALTDYQRRSIVATANLDQLGWDATLDPLWHILTSARRRVTPFRAVRASHDVAILAR
jgi:sugar transferase (PEP-CTERM/EpsH1 system associated)